MGGAGLTNCGAALESCCTSLEVPGGTYYRTYTTDGTTPSNEADPATVSGFRLDKYLVTVGRFRQFVAAWSDGFLPVAGSGKHVHLNGGQGLANSANPGTYEAGWDAVDWNNTTDVDPTTANLTTACISPTLATWTATPGPQENLPISCVNWWEAYAFCIWDGGFLPSEAEWEYAAFGGSAQLEYPWGSTSPGTQCPGTGCEYAIYNCDYPSGSGLCMGVASIAPVGTATLGAGLWGQLDMEGEVFEWVIDSYAYPYVNPCIDCAELTADGDRVDRGGYFEEEIPPPSNRAYGPPATRGYGLGFRCARTP